ncbi:MAG: hypothetical protein ACI4U0_00670 [Candidatus Aphodocola sp.]
MNLFLDSPMLLIAVIVFIVCVIIGFFGDRYLRSQNKIDKILGNDKQAKEENTIDEKEEASRVEETPLMTSENINQIVTDNTMVSSLENQSSDFVSQSMAANSNVVQPSINDNFINQPVTQPNNNIINSVNNVDVISQPINYEINNPTINNMYQEVSEPISPMVEPENIQLEENYPPENNPSNVSGQPVPFDGQITTDENVNNMF